MSTEHEAPASRFVGVAEIVSDPLASTPSVWIGKAHVADEVCLKALFAETTRAVTWMLSREREGSSRRLELERKNSRWMPLEGVDYVSLEGVEVSDVPEALRAHALAFVSSSPVV